MIWNNGKKNAQKRQHFSEYIFMYVLSDLYVTISELFSAQLGLGV